jgi:CBS-domain-containing membrane protein
MFRRYDLQTDILLAVMPAVVMIAVLMLLDTFGKQEILFSSLASSAFLIYLEPKHPTNKVRTLLISQLTASVIGYLVYISIGSGYTSAGISMILSIMVMILTKAMHPPAVSTALVFAFQHTKPNTLLMFFCAVVLMVILVGLQRSSLWLIKRSERRKKAIATGVE